MATYSIDKIKYGDNVYSLIDNTSGYTKNTGTITGITMNGSSKGTSGVVDLGTVLTSHQDISGKIDTAGTGLSKSGTTLNHSNSVTAQTTQAIYPIKIDAQGHISAYGTAVTPLTSSSTLSAAKLDGAIKNGVTATTQSAGDNSTKVATTAYVDTAISGLPTPMQFLGSVGTGGTITSLPTAAASNSGNAYKVITALSTPAAKVGDMVISNGSEWVVIPSGDEPSGTVTSVKVQGNNGLTGSGTVTSSGTITISHDDTSSQESITAASRTYVTAVTLDDYGHVTGLTTGTETVTNTDTKVSTAAVTSGTTYYPVVGSDTTSAATKYYDKTGIVYVGTNGTTSAVGTAALTLGNSTASGTANNKKGQVVLYGSTAYATTIDPGAPSAARTLTLPNKTGTLATTADIPSVPTSAANHTTGVTVADHSTTTITGVSGSTSVYGVKSGTGSTTTASKASGGNGSAPTLGTAISVQSKSGGSNGTAPSLTFAINGSDSNQLDITWSAGSASSWTFESKSIPNVTNVGSASTWSFTDVTVPIRADSATTVPTAASSATTVVTSKGHTVNDTGHTHTLS